MEKSNLVARNIQAIIACVDRYLEQSGELFVGPVFANRLLKNAGLLRDSESRPGKPLRELLRQGKIPHAYQSGGHNTDWNIPHSRGQFQVKPRLGPAIHKTKNPAMPVLSQSPCGDLTGYIAQLMDAQSISSVGEIDDFVPNEPGLYCLRIPKVDALPAPYARALKERGHNIIYIGIASQSLKTRLLGEELRARGNGTFFRSIGAVLGYRPILGSLVNKANQKNYKFSSENEKSIIQWMNHHLAARWITFYGDCEGLENQLIRLHLPLLNLQGNPAKLQMLEDARQACRDIARNDIPSTL